jgi:hypothetical protein
MQTFKDNDEGYLAWLTANPTLYVLNAERSLNPNNLVLHRATCRHINDTPSRGARWTVDYIKVCGGRQTLEGYARDLGGEARRSCTCL